MDEEDDDQKGRKLALQSLVAHLGYDNDGDENAAPQDSAGSDDGMNFSNLTTEAKNFGKKKKGGSGGGGGMGGMDMSSLMSMFGGGGGGGGAGGI